MWSALRDRRLLRYKFRRQHPIGKFIVDGSTFDTDGFKNVVENERGVIDNEATVQYNNVNLKLDYSPAPSTKAFFRTVQNRAIGGG